MPGACWPSSPLSAGWRAACAPSPGRGPARRASSRWRPWEGRRRVATSGRVRGGDARRARARPPRIWPALDGAAGYPGDRDVVLRRHRGDGVGGPGRSRAAYADGRSDGRGGARAARRLPRRAPGGAPGWPHAPHGPRVPVLPAARDPARRGIVRGQRGRDRGSPGRGGGAREGSGAGATGGLQHRQAARPGDRRASGRDVRGPDHGRQRLSLGRPTSRRTRRCWPRPVSFRR